MAAHRNAQERGGTDGAALVCARPALGSGKSFPDGGEEHCKVPCSTSGSGSSVLMYSGLSSTSLWLCGSAAPLLPDLLLACWHSVPSVTGGKDSGKRALPYSLPKNDLVLHAGCLEEDKSSTPRSLGPFCWERKGQVAVPGPEGGSKGTG